MLEFPNSTAMLAGLLDCFKPFFILGAAAIVYNLAMAVIEVIKNPNNENQ